MSWIVTFIRMIFLFITDRHMGMALYYVCTYIRDIPVPIPSQLRNWRFKGISNPRCIERIALASMGVILNQGKNKCTVSKEVDQCS